MTVSVNITGQGVQAQIGQRDAPYGSSSLTLANTLVSVASSGVVKQSAIADGSISGLLTIAKTGTTARTVTFPDAAITVARTDSAQTFTGTQTVLAAATQDAIALSGRAGGSSSYVLSLTPTTLTGSRVATFPDAAITVPGIALAQTWTANQTFNGVSLINTADSTGAVYWGPTDTDGSVRSYGNGSGAFIIEARVSGSWVEIGRFET